MTGHFPMLKTHHRTFLFALVSLSWVSACSLTTSLDGLNESTSSNSAFGGTGGQGATNGSAGIAGNTTAGTGGQGGVGGASTSGNAGVSGTSSVGGNSGAGNNGSSGTGGTNGQSGSAGVGGSNPCDGVDFQTSADHCGQCNHSCLGGECVSGSCQPFVLVQGLGKPRGISISNDGTLYIADKGKGRIFTMPSSGGMLDFVALDTPPNDVFDVAEDSNIVYWSEYDPNEVRKAARSGGASSHAVWGLEHAAFLMVLGTTIYLTDFRIDAPNLGSITVGTPSTPNGATIYESQGLLAGIGFNPQGKLIWSRGDPGELVEGTTSGGSTSQIINGLSNVAGIAVDTQYVYWISQPNQVWRVPQSGVNPEKIYESSMPIGYAGLDGVCDIAVDDKAIYWSENLRQRIMKLAK
jgi:hypothetical protein